jgi:hypothetical protein
MWSFRLSETADWILTYEDSDGSKTDIIKIPNAHESEIAGIAIDLERSNAVPIKN